MVGQRVKMYTPKVAMKIAPPMIAFSFMVGLSNHCILLWSEKGVKHLTSNLKGWGRG